MKYREGETAPTSLTAKLLALDVGDEWIFRAPDGVKAEGDKMRAKARQSPALRGRKFATRKVLVIDGDDKVTPSILISRHQ